MKEQLIIILIFSVFLNSFSQNYLSIKPDAVSYYYATGDNSVSPVRIDSVKINGDSTEYFSFRMIRPVPNSMYYTEKGPSWVGNKMVDCGNGNNLFFNKNNDTILIITNSQLYESWKMFSFINDDYVEATITNISIDTIIGLIDSVKTISLQVKNNSGNNISNLLNSLSLKLSKNFGFFKIFNFYEFPFDTSPLGYYPTSQELDIIGISNPVAGWQNIKLFDVFTMQLGDEIHYNYSYLNGPYPGAYSQNSQIIEKYLNRNENSTNDTIIFTIEICKKTTTHHYSPYDTVITSYHDTTLSTITTSNDYFDKLPLEPFNDGYFWGYYNKVDSFGYQPGDIYNPDFNDSLTPALYNGWSDTYYIKKFGNETFQFYNYYNGDQASQVFQYYNVNGTTWGSPYICDSLLSANNIIESNKEISIFPNPANNFIFINSTDKNIDDLNVQVYDMQGRLLLTKQITESNEQIDISIIPQGIYLTKITNQKTSSNYKLIISR